MAEEEIVKGRLLIEENHYFALLELIDQFGRFETGKGQLIDLRKIDSRNKTIDAQIQDAVHRNGQIRERYIILLDDVSQSFRSQIRGKGFAEAW